MADRVYPTAKPNPPPASLNNGSTIPNGTGPAKTGQLYNPKRPPPNYRPQQNRRSNRSCSCRKCCCLTFIYTLIAILSLILLASIAACIFYVLYHPKHPIFSVSSIRFSKFNLSSSDSSGFTHLNSRLDFTLTAKNPNKKKKIAFVYDPMSVELSTAGVDAGNATLPAFTHVAGNTTILKASVVSDPTRDFDSDTVSQLRSDLGKKSGFPVTAELNTMVEVQMGKIKTKKIGIRVTCDGIKGFQPKNASAKTPTPGTTSDAKCKVDLRIKIWKFTF